MPDDTASSGSNATHLAERRYRALLEQSPFATQVFAPDGSAITANAAWERLWDTTRDQLAGYNVLRDPQLAAKGVLPLIARAFGGEAVTTPAVRYDPAEIGKVGRPRWVAGTCYPVTDETGAILEVVLILEDVTAHHEAEAERERLTAELRYQLDRSRTIADNAASCLCTMDALGRPTFVNPAFSRVTGYTLDEIQDRPLHYAVHYKYPDGRPYPMEDCPIDRAYPIMVPVPYGEEIFVRKDGSFFPVAFSVAPLARDGQAVGAVLEFRDITQQKEAAAERERLLAREHEARLEAEAALRLRDEFLSAAAHELKTPATTLLGMAQMMLRRLDREGTLRPDRVRRAFETIGQQTVRLARLVEQLLDVSRIGTGQMILDRRETDLTALVRGAVEAAEMRADSHGFDVRLPDRPAVAFVDPLRMEQAIHNLLDNAIKFSPAGSRIDVEVRAPGDGQPVRISVRDRGVGVAPEQRHAIFDRFYQAHSGSHYGGMGLGLYITKEIVQLHGGWVEADFPEDGGSRFTLVLPAAASEGTVS